MLLLLNAQSKLSGDHFTGASEHSVCKVVQKVWETIASGYVMLHPRRYTRYHSLIMECWECSVIIMSCIGCERGCKCRWVFATKMQNSFWEPCNFVLKRSEDKNDEGEIKHDQLGTAIRKCSYNWYKASQVMFSYATISQLYYSVHIFLSISSPLVCLHRWLYLNQNLHDKYFLCRILKVIYTPISEPFSFPLDWIYFSFRFLFTVVVFFFFIRCFSWILFSSST